MTSEQTWPALQLDEPLPALVDYERGIWGKVHGAPTDFRWMARSRQFTHKGDDLQMQLSLGGEDAPERFIAWRNLGRHCYAVAGYASRATDAAGRRGFVEKQILEWHRPAGIPAAVGALLLLPHAAALADACWWERHPGEIWQPSGAFLSMDASEHEPLVLDRDRIDAAIERGRTLLRESISQDSLERLYEQLLTARRPSLLTGVPQPLAPEALAALLLPLPREVADRLSLAGWIPSTRPSLADLGSRWDVLVSAHAQAIEPVGSETAAQMASALFSTVATSWSLSTVTTDDVPAAVPAPTISLRPGVRLALTPPQRDDAPVLSELYEFAAAADRRWLAPEALRQTSRMPKPGGAAARLIASWIDNLRKPDHADDEQWTVKIDLLRSAAIVLVPEPATVQRVGLPSRVPALFYGLSFDRPQQWNSLATLGEHGLREVLAQSASCGAPRTLSEPLRQALLDWRATMPHDLNVRVLLSNALETWPRP
ncbi:MAG TPA: hypothetical protein VGF69_17180 [Thermoanaerobaculia bacterium]|jgi:hypothetical protein